MRPINGNSLAKKLVNRQRYLEFVSPVNYNGVNTHQMYNTGMRTIREGAFQESLNTIFRVMGLPNENDLHAVRTLPMTK